MKWDLIGQDISATITVILIAASATALIHITAASIIEAFTAIAATEVETLAINLMAQISLEQTAEEWYEPLYRFALSLSKNPDDAMDLTQSAFLN